ncbi:ABC transporter ATP-binding protein [Paracoccus aminophilus]|uniref:ABC-type nitrate/sulfonate/bicarbonate transport system, ATPase component n=1 Tax=Paracoccus aminophilus JCM 7686 TaxID=1367847 RepID=S5Y141_PARAH|nr:ABC transporter ATP-binding protein [Paracoccus aminophilus]AGT11212.1 ABC-type nitrate/sulfonate/bicarbonate transport system, ATPase component [Paracoccus aminophilus JCM 7686]
MPEPTAPQILFDHVSLAFQPGGAPAIEDVSLTIPQGEVLVVLGPSGCGKTTLLRLIAGLIRPSAGRVLVNGAAPRPGASSATVFQNFRLLPWKTVAENIAFVLPDLPRPEREARIARYLGLVGLSRVAKSYPRALSGGMQQRVALARALAAEPEILLMDEPFASLDAQSRELMQGEVLKLTRAGPQGSRRTVVFVTHSVDEALVLGDRVLLMSPRPGRVAELIALPFARQSGDPRRHPDFISLRDRLWEELRHMVLSDPQSDFYGRG